MSKVKLAPVLLCLMLAACVATGTMSFDQQLAGAYQTHTAVLNGAADAVERGTMKPDDAAKILALADQSRALLDSARGLAVTDPTTAEGKLQLAASILTQLQTYLAPKVKP